MDSGGKRYLVFGGKCNRSILLYTHFSDFIFIVNRCLYIIVVVTRRQVYKINFKYGIPIILLLSIVRTHTSAVPTRHFGGVRGCMGPLRIVVAFSYHLQYYIIIMTTCFWVQWRNFGGVEGGHVPPSSFKRIPTASCKYHYYLGFRILYEPNITLSHTFTFFFLLDIIQMFEIDFFIDSFYTQYLYYASRWASNRAHIIIPIPTNNICAHRVSYRFSVLVI